MRYNNYIVKISAENIIQNGYIEVSNHTRRYELIFNSPSHNETGILFRFDGYPFSFLITANDIHNKIQYISNP